MPDAQDCPYTAPPPGTPTGSPVPPRAAPGWPTATPPPPALSDALRWLTGPTMTRRTVRAGRAVHGLGVDGSGWTIVVERPLDRLVGWRAPASCRAVAVVTSGRVLAGDTPGGARPARSPVPGIPGAVDGDLAAHLGSLPDGSGVEVAVAVDRCGATAGRIAADGYVDEHPPAGGRLLDTLRRTLALPTPAAPESTARLLAVLWLAEVARVVIPADGVGAAEVTDWRRLLQQHPAVRLLLGLGERLRLDQMERIVAISPSTWTWDVLREAESSHGAMAPLCPPGAAGWMDDGMYARWVSADLPSFEQLRARLVEHLPTATARRLERALAASGVRCAPGQTGQTGRVAC